ncbi:hypothetical protein N7528_005292 [Penicillium herquei]|nr:hypothetical protein N7528_005292 [Penicillium herquei]
MTTTSGSTTPASSNLGPLTTVFTPPSECFTEQWVQQGNASYAGTLMWGWDCNTSGAGEASICYQSSQYDAILSWKKSDTGNLNYVFSPGYVCPSGWEVLLASTYGQTADTDYDIGAASVTMVPGDILTACCPSGYTLIVPSAGESGCLSWTDSLGVRESLVTDLTGSSQCTYTTVSAMNSSDAGANFEAFPYFLLHNTITSTSTVSSATSSSSASSSTSQIGSSNGGNSGLSTGAKIAIGVCVPAGVLILAAICFMIYHRRRKSKEAQEAALPPATGSEQTHGPQYGGFELKSELDPSAAILPGSVKAPQEMSASDRYYELDSRQQAELAGTQTYHAELDGGSTFVSSGK